MASASRLHKCAHLSLRFLGALGFTLTGLSHAQVGSAAADVDEAIVPYRPTVSNPAQLPLPGRPELELGGQQARMPDASRLSMPYVLKLAFTPEWGIFLGGDAYVRAKDAFGRDTGMGDTTVTVKRAWLVDDAAAFGVELGAKLPTAKSSLGSGHTDYSLNGIASRDLGPVHVDLNANLTRIGGAEAGSSRSQWGAALAVSAPVSDHFGLAAEISGTRRRHADHSEQLLTALTYSPTKQLTLDFGITRSPHPASTQWFTGAVFPLGRLW